MLDTIIKSIMRKLDAHVNEVRDQRIKIERERASGSPRKIATAILKHPEGFATSPRDAAESAQKAYAKARAEWEQDGVPMLARLATLAIARERRDETAAAFRRHEDAEANRKATKVHPDFRRLNDAMIAHGVQTGHAATATDGIIAIASDLYMWAGVDPDLLDPDSPLRAIIEIYATRQILTPGQFGDRSRSQPGVPIRQVKHTDPEYYMFNEVLNPAGDDGGEDEGNPTVDAPIEVIPPPVASESAVGSTQKVAASIDDYPHVLPIVLKADANDAQQTISPEFAKRIAETVYDKDPIKLGIYWPRDGYSVGDFEPARLIPALESWIAEGAWSGAERFLEAARAGQARQFIDGVRRDGVERMAGDIMRGDERALAAARAVGFDV